MKLKEIITATDLKQWADTKECQQYLPLLMRKLIRATVSGVESLSIPCGDSTHLPGWDGIVVSQSNIHNAPKGKSVWEFGCDKKYKQKANRDLSKRTKNSRGEEVKDTTFVFVTPREWQNAAEWVQEKKRNSKWKDIVVISAVELEDWLSCTPAVCLWLADLLNKLPGSGVETIEHWWNNWANGNGISLPYSLLLGGRASEKQLVIDACDTHEQIHIEANTQAESVAFAIASICTDENNLFAEKTLVVSTSEAYQYAVNHYVGLVIISTVKESGNDASKRNHSVIFADSVENLTQGATVLPTIPKEDFVSAIKGIGIDDDKARSLALETIRDVNVLRRLLEIDLYKPDWASLDSLPVLLPALIIGRWNTAFEGDKELLSLMAGKPYKEYKNALKPYLRSEDTPFVIVDNIYRVKSSFEVINSIVDNIEKDDLELLADVISRLIEDKDDDAIAKMTDTGIHFWQYKQKYSTTIREGVFQTLALFSFLSQRNTKIKEFVDNQMRMFYEKMDLQVYLSNKSFLNLIVEASPERFLFAIEKDIKNGGTLMSQLFEYRPNTFSLVGGNIYYSELLWALESAAWAPECLLRVTNILMSLCQYPHKNNYVNSPFHSLNAIYRPYFPQTNVGFESRLSILKQAKEKNPEICFKLCIESLSFLREYMSFEMSQCFRWCHYEDNRGEKRTGYYNHEYVNGLVSLLLCCTDACPNNIHELITISVNKHIGRVRCDVIKYLESKQESLVGNTVFIDHLRKEITRQKQCADAVWSLSRAQLLPLCNLLAAIESKDLMERYRWMFYEDYIQLPEKRDFGEKHLQHVLDIRTNAVRQIIEQKGESAFWDFVNMVKCPASLSECFISIYGNADLEMVYTKFCQNLIPQSFAMDYFKRLCYQFGIDHYIEKAADLKQIDKSCLCIYLYAPGYKEKIWDYIQAKENDLTESYWKNVDIFYIDKKPESMLDQLCAVERYKDVLHLINWNSQDVVLSDPKKLSILQNMIDKKKFDALVKTIDDVSDILESLDKSEDPEIQKALVPIEFLLFDHLHHRRNQQEMRFIKAIMHDPSLLIQLIEMVYKKDDDAPEEQLSEEELQYLSNAQHLAFPVFFNLNVPPCLKEDNTIDEKELKNYIDSLVQLAKERHIVNSTYSVIGQLLGNIPLGEDYPPRYLCEIVESLEDSEKVGRGLCRQLFNRQGFTSRSYNEGGAIERRRVARYEEYKRKVMYEYPIMTNVFDYLIKDYERQGLKEDSEAKMMDLDN